MESMVVGVVVSAFLLTPFFVCREHRRDKHSQGCGWHFDPSKSLLRPGPSYGPNPPQGIGERVPPLCSAAGTGPVRGRRMHAIEHCIMLTKGQQNNPDAAFYSLLGIPRSEPATRPPWKARCRNHLASLCQHAWSKSEMGGVNNLRRQCLHYGLFGSVASGLC